MLRYYVMEEDTESEYRIYPGEICLNPDERRAMILGQTEFIPVKPLLIELKYRLQEEMSDYLSLKFTFASHELRAILKENTTSKLFFRPVFLLFDGREYQYYYVSPEKYDCIDFKNSRYEKSEKMPGGIMINDGFAIRSEVVKNIDIFRVEGLSGRKIVISDRLKEIFEHSHIKGIRYTEIGSYRDTGTGTFSVSN